MDIAELREKIMLEPQAGPWRQQDAIDFCIEIEKIAPRYGYHVALTGGCLYKPEADRKDADILFYSIRQQKPQRKRLLQALTTLGVKFTQSYNWLQKGTYKGKSVDFFFPETKKKTNEEYAQ